MNPISTAKDFDLIDVSIDRVIDRSRTLPDRVFRNTLKYFLFITFDELRMTLFFNHIKQYLIRTGERKFWLTTIDPDPRSRLSITLCNCPLRTAPASFPETQS